MTTPTKLFVTPATGLLVLDPATGQPLPSAEARPKGTRVVVDTYWHKRLASGDVVQVAPAPAPAQEADAAPAPPELAPSTPERPALPAPVDEAPAPTTKHSKPKDK